MHRDSALAAGAVLCCTLLFGLGVYGPFVLWAFGLIPVYEIALVISIILAIFIIIMGLPLTKQIGLQPA